MVRRKKSWGTIRSGRNNICGMKDHKGPGWSFGVGWCMLGVGKILGKVKDFLR
jgi:hypothetical protein